MIVSLGLASRAAAAWLSATSTSKDGPATVLAGAAQAGVNANRPAANATPPSRFFVFLVMTLPRR